MKIRILSLDFEGTLVRIEDMDWFWREHIPSLYSKKTGKSLSESKDIIYRDYEEVGTQRPEWYIPEYWFKKYDIAEEYTHSVKMLCDKIVPMEDVTELEVPESIEVIICSNTWEDIIRMSLDKIKLNAKVTRIFTPQSFGLTKKDKDFYKKIGRILGLGDCSCILHVGDNLEYDYLAPLSAGWRALLIERRKEKVSANSIKDIKQDNFDSVMKVDSLKQVSKYVT
jgi:FMN phosphatase YigB (HAD superfamily)